MRATLYSTDWDFVHVILRLSFVFDNHFIEHLRVSWKSTRWKLYFAEVHKWMFILVKIGNREFAKIDMWGATIFLYASRELRFLCTAKPYLTLKQKSLFNFLSNVAQCTVSILVVFTLPYLKKHNLPTITWSVLHDNVNTFHAICG